MPCAPSSREHKELLLVTALKYWDHGFWPVPKDGKRNFTKGWSTKQIDRDELVSCIKKGWQLGVVLGPDAGGLVCVDIDTKANRSGLAWLNANQTRLGNALIETTPSGGYHIYYRYPSGEAGERLRGVTKWALKDNKGVEVFISRAQVNTWPTPGYVLDSDAAGLTDIHRYDELPGWIVDLVPPPPTVERVDMGETDDPDELAAARTKLARHGQAERGRMHDQHLYNAGCIGHDHGIPQDIWLAVLLDWNQDNLPGPFPERRVQDKVKNAYRYAQNGLGQKTRKARVSARAADFPDDQEPAPATKTVAPAGPTDSGEPYDFKEADESAARFLKSLGGLVSMEGDYYLYRDNNWGRVSEAELKHLLYKRIAATTSRKGLKDSHKTEIMKALGDMVYKQTQPLDHWRDGRRGDYVRCRNGILNLDTLALEDHSPDWFSTVMLPFDYDPALRSPRWDGFLASCFPRRPDVVESLNAFLGYTLSSCTVYQRWMALWGQPRSGKSTIVRVLTQLLGGARFVLSTEVRSFAGDFGLANAETKKLIVIAEAGDPRRDDAGNVTAKMLKIVGGDNIQVTRKHKDSEDLLLKSKLFMVTNAFPSLPDPGGALTVKMIPIRFTESFLGREDHELEADLFAELAGILNTILAAYRRAKAAGKLPVPNDVTEEIQEIHEQMNPTEAFIADYIEFVAPDTLGPTEKLPPMILSDAYDAYKEWCVLRSHQPRSIAKFSQSIRLLFSQHEPAVSRVKTRERSDLRDKTTFTNLRLRAYATNATAAGFPDDHNAF